MSIIHPTTHNDELPGGLWASIAQAADAPTVGAGDVWRGIERRLVNEQENKGQLWQTLTALADPAQYRPCALPDVPEEPLREGDQQLIVIRSPRGNYLRLTPLQHEIWHQMDGTRTIGQLAMQTLLKHKQLAPDGTFIATLKQEGFLTDTPVGVYRVLEHALEQHTAEGWGRRVLRWLSGTSWRIHHIDALYGAIYRVFGWLLFTPIFAIVWFAVAFAGLVAFSSLVLGSPQVAIVQSSGVPLELAGLWCALLVSFLLHESAHALAVKHYDRTLYSGGMMLYFGTPAFFVDTSDIWRSPRRARIVVSAAGPMSDLFVGALAALFVYLHHDAAFASIAYKLALTCYIATLFNLNPLLELDGYFILVDWLRLPDLRRRALAFVRGPLWAKFGRKDKPATPSAHLAFVGRAPLVIQPFTREERIFTLYGALALVYAVVAATFAVQFWNKQLLGTIAKLWSSNSWLAQVVAAALMLLVVIPLLVGLGLAGFGLGRAAVAWLIQRGYGRRPALLSGVALALALVLTLIAASAGERWWIAVLPPLLWALARGALLAMRPDYRGAAIAPALDAFAVATVLATIAALLRFLLQNVEHPWSAPGIATLGWSAADGLAMLTLLVAGFFALLDVNLRLAPTRELIISAVLLVLAFLVGGAAQLQAALSDQHYGLITQFALAAPAYFGAVALALLLPHLQALRDSRLVWPWGLAWVATATQTVVYVVELGDARRLWLDVLVAALWAGAWLIHLATVRQITPAEFEWHLAPSTSEAQRLERAFTACYAGCYRLLRAVYGSRRTRELDDRMDVLSATANWDVTLDRDQARIGATLLTETLDQQGERFAEVLRYTVATIENIAGQAFALRAIQAAYDALPWPERETASRLCFPDTPWARALSNAFGDAQAGRLRLLRQVDLLLNCDDDELIALDRNLHEQTFNEGTLLLRAGEPVPGVWIVVAGEVLAQAMIAEQRLPTDENSGQLSVVEFHRGEAFGTEEVLSDGLSLWTYQTTLDTSVLFIPADEFRKLIREQAPHAADGLAHRETLRLLERVPLFADLPRHALRGLVQIAREQQFEARRVIVKQDQPNGMLYIITRGRAAVLVRSSEPSAKLRLVAQLGSEEFFGEIELLRGTPPVATIVSATPMTVLALPHAAVRALLLNDSNIARSLEQIGTGRLITLRQGAMGAA